MIRRLEEAGTPQAQAVLRQIADGPRALEREFAAAHRERLPVRAAELQAPLPPSERNAAPVYVQLTRLLKERPLDAGAQKVLVDLGVRTPHTPEEVEAVRGLIESRLDVMALVDQAAAKSQCVFQRDWSLGPAMPTPEYAKLREAVRLLKARSYLLAKEGHYRDAVASLTGALHVANHVSEEPGQIAFVVGIACRSLALAGLEDVLYLAGPNAEVADAVQTALNGNPPAFRMRRALAGELVASSIFLEQIRQELVRVGPGAVAEMLAGIGQSGRSQAPQPPTAPSRKLTRVQARQAGEWLQACEADYVSRLRRAVAVAGQPYPARRAFVRAATVSHAEAERNPTRLITAIMFPLVGQVDTKLASAQAREICVIAAAKILAYRARHDRFPDRLESVLTKPLVDPFTNRPLQYHREREGFVLSSVGPPQDMGGNQTGEKRDGGPISFRYPAPPSAHPAGGG